VIHFLVWSRARFSVTVAYDKAKPQLPVTFSSVCTLLW